MRTKNSQLSCAVKPCPHKSICCTHGVTILPSEVLPLAAYCGAGNLVYNNREFRTVVVNGHCVFSSSNGCRLHHTSVYPKVCRKFPLDKYLGSDPDLCPEVKPATKLKEVGT